MKIVNVTRSMQNFPSQDEETSQFSEDDKDFLVKIFKSVSNFTEEPRCQ